MAFKMLRKQSISVAPPGSQVAQCLWNTHGVSGALTVSPEHLWCLWSTHGVSGALPGALHLPCVLNQALCTEVAAPWQWETTHQ